MRFVHLVFVVGVVWCALGAQLSHGRDIEPPPADATFFEVIKTDDVDGIDLMEDFRYAVFAHKDANRVSVWDILERKEVASIETPSPSCVLARGKSIYVGNDGEGLVSVFDGAKKWLKVAEVKLPAPTVATLSAPGGKAFKGQLLAHCHVDLKLRQTVYVDTKTKKAVALGGAPGPSTGAAVDFDGKFFIFQATDGSPARYIAACKSWPMLVAGRDVDVARAPYETLPIIRQVQSGPFWIAGNRICKGTPPTIMGEVRDQFVIPDRRKQLAYVFPNRTKLEALELKGTLSSLGTRSVYFPKEHGRFIEMNPHVTCFYDFLSFAVTGDDKKLRIYSYDGKQKLVWTLLVDAFDGADARASQEPMVATNVPPAEPPPRPMPKPVPQPTPKSVPQPTIPPPTSPAPAAENFVQEELTPELKAHLRDPDEAHLAEYIRLTKNADPKTRVKALFALGELKVSDQVTAAVLARASDPDTKVRMAVGGAIFFLEPPGPEAIKVIERLLADPQPDVQAEAVLGAGVIGRKTPALALAIARLLPTADDNTCKRILRQLDSMDIPPEAAPLIKGAYPKYEADAIKPLARISPPPPELIPWLREVLNSDAFYKAWEEAAVTLGRFDDAEYLIAQAKGKYQPRLRALHGLGALTKPNAEANQLLIAGMSDPEVTIRIAAVWGAGQQRKPDENVLLAVFNACDDADGSVRQQCRNSLDGLMYQLESLQPEQAVAVVDKALLSKPKDVGLLLAKAYVTHPLALRAGSRDVAKSLDYYNTLSKGLVQVVLKSDLKLMPFEKEELGEVFFEASVVACMAKNNGLSLKYLQVALENGYKQFDEIEEHPGLKPIREQEQYKQLIAKYKKN